MSTAAERESARALADAKTIARQQMALEAIAACVEEFDKDAITALALKKPKPPEDQ